MLRGGERIVNIFYIIYIIYIYYIYNVTFLLADFTYLLRNCNTVICNQVNIEKC